MHLVDVDIGNVVQNYNLLQFVNERRILNPYFWKSTEANVLRVEGLFSRLNDFLKEYLLLYIKSEHRYIVISIFLVTL
jgi:hypothetical protein